MSKIGKFLEPILIVLIALFAPIKSTILTAFAMVVLDLITGVWAAKVRKDPITSNGLKRTLIKLFIYETAICLAFIAETYLILDLFPVAKIVSSFVGVTELKSIYENLNEIGGGDLLKAVISKLNGPNE